MTKDTEHTLSIIDQLFDVIKKYKDTDNPVVKELCDILGVEESPAKVYQVSQSTLNKIKNRKRGLDFICSADRSMGTTFERGVSGGLSMAIQAIEQDKVD